jgi:hypothetical protein
MAMDGVRRHHQHRRRTRTAFTGAAAVVVAAVVFASQLGETSTATLEQDQPAVTPTTQATPGPSAVADTLAVPPAPVNVASGSPATSRAGGSAGDVGSGPVAPGRQYDSTRWKRAFVPDTYAPGWGCSALVSEWTSTGWCIQARLPSTIRSGHLARLDVQVCRTGVDRGVLTFPNRQQAGVQLWEPKHHRLVWSSSERASPFRAGERLVVANGRCLQWTTVWSVRAGGQPIAPGSYQFQWTTGTGIKTPTGRSDHSLQAVKVSAA